jgi:RNA polymerase sigma factor (sigma-70 family)
MNMHPSLRNPQHKINGNFKAEFGELYTLLWDKMLNTVCRKYTKDIDKAKDYCQNGFIKVYNNFSKYKEKGSKEAWVSRVINNHIIDELRKSEVEIYDGGEDGFDFSGITYSEDVCEESEYSISEIMGLIKYLSPSYKRVFEMYYLEGLKHNEISEILSISLSTSKTNLMKAKKNLKKYLQNGAPSSIKNN